MGRLIAPRKLKLQFKPKRFVLSWLPPLLLTIIVLFGIHTGVKADPAPSSSELAQYLQNNELNVATTVIGDYQQVYYRYNDRTVVLTKEGYNHSHAVSSGQYIAWEGLIDGNGHIFIYDILSNALTQLSTTSNNQTPFIYRNTVTWTAWDGRFWQIMYYDGTTVRQITDAQNSSVYASTNGQKIIYAEQLDPTNWQAKSYDIASGQVEVIREGDIASTAYPQFNSDGTITTNFVPQ